MLQLLERLLHWSSKQSPFSCSALKLLLHKPATSQLAGLSCLSSHETSTCMGKRGTSGRPSLSPVTSKRSWNWNSSLVWMSWDPKDRNIFPFLFSLQTSLPKQPLPKLTCRYYKDTMETRHNVDAYQRWKSLRGIASICTEPALSVREILSIDKQN